MKDRFIRYWPQVCYFLADLEALHLRHSDSVLVIGSGRESKVSGFDVVNTDIRPFGGVHVVSDAQALCFAADSFDAIVCHQVLEHIPDADKAVSEMYRVLRPEGRIIVTVPFYFPFHASPFDFRRWTVPGLRQTFKAFHETDTGMYIGPVGAFLTAIQHGVGILLPWFLVSYLIKGLIGYLLLPFKYLDLLVARLPNAIHMAASVYYVGRKPPS